VPVELRERAQELLNEAVPGDQAVDVKVRLLLEVEYLRRLARYRRTDQAMARKYAMSFDAFVAQKIVRQQGYSWEVESDAINWETTVGGIMTVERLLKELRDASDG
jgi:hypothetical protein